jgi:hypothetical protein
MGSDREDRVMDDPTNRPLWQVMRKAYIESSGSIINDLGQEVLSGPDREEFAAMIRAIAQWIRQRHPLSPGSETYIGASVVAAELLAEAAKAEAGD